MTFLTGVIDAAVNGGIAKYQQAFLSKEEVEEGVEPYPDTLRRQLRRALHKQMDVVEMALIYHSKLCPAGMKGLQNKLETFFTTMRTNILEACQIDNIEK